MWHAQVWRMTAGTYCQIYVQRYLLSSFQIQESLHQLLSLLDLLMGLLCRRDLKKTNTETMNLHTQLIQVVQTIPSCFQQRTGLHFFQTEYYACPQCVRLREIPLRF